MCVHVYVFVCVWSKVPRKKKATLILRLYKGSGLEEFCKGRELERLQKQSQNDLESIYSDFHSYLN